MEWAYRLLQEPRRLWRRYLFTNTVFIRLLATERINPRPPYIPSPRVAVEHLPDRSPHIPSPRSSRENSR